MDQEQVELKVSENVLHALDFAVNEAQQRMTSSDEPLVPFSVIVIDEGLEVAEHPGDTPNDVHDSVRMLLAQEMPEGYAFCYDGYVETDEGTLDALVVEVADRGCVAADAIAVLYTMDGGEYDFQDDYAYLGATPQLYPAGTKPIVSGLDALDEDEPTDRDFVDLPEEEPQPEGEAEAEATDEAE